MRRADIIEIGHQWRTSI